MPLEQMMSTLAVLMLMVALVGSTVFAQPIFRIPPWEAGTQAPIHAEKIECIIERIELRDLKLFGKVEEQSVEFKVVPQVRVTKDQKPAKLESLARGDFAVLTLASQGSDVVVKVEAVSSR